MSKVRLQRELDETNVKVRETSDEIKKLEETMDEKLEEEKKEVRGSFLITA